MSFPIVRGLRWRLLPRSEMFSEWAYFSTILSGRVAAGAEKGGHMQATRDHALLLITAFLALNAPIWAQNGGISGIIKDSSDAAVPRAAVAVVNEETGIKRSLTTNEAGIYSAPSLIPGMYRVTVEAAGFQTAARDK